MNERHWLETITRENLVINFGNTVFNLTGLEAAFGHFRLVVAHHLLQSHPNGPPGLPLQALLGTGGIRPPLLGGRQSGSACTQFQGDASVNLRPPFAPSRRSREPARQTRQW